MIESRKLHYQAGNVSRAENKDTLFTNIELPAAIRGITFLFVILAAV